MHMQRRRFLETCAAAALTPPAELSVAADATARRYDRARLAHADGSPIKANAIPARVNFLFHYPFAGTPCFLLNLGQPLDAGAPLRTSNARTYRWPGGVGPQRNIVAYSAICPHRLSYPTRQISFISYRAEPSPRTKHQQVIRCCSEYSEYDPARGAAVVGGPAPQPLAAILLDYDPQADALYAVGTLGGEMFEKFFSKFGFQLSMQFGGRERQPVGDQCVVVEMTQYCRQEVRC